ncbi:ABC transporter ATP-binding protein, partial [Delftia acidovorans]
MHSTDADDPQAGPGPIAQTLQPIRAQLVLAALLSFAGAVLALAPLAGIAHIARLALADGGMVATDAWRVIVLCLVCLFAGMALVSAGELVAHLADNRLTHGLRLSAMQRLARVPLGWFTERASGQVKQAMQDDVATLHELTAHFYTTVGRGAGTVAASAVYLVAMDWRMALVSALPFGIFFLVMRHAMQASGAHMPAFGAGLARINNAVVEFVNGIPVVKAFGASGRAHGSYREAVDGFTDAFLGFARPLVSARANANALIAPVAVLGVVLAFGTLFTALGWMAPVDVLPFALVAPGISAPLQLLSFNLHALNHATGAAQRVQALLRTPVLEQPAADQCRLPQGCEVRFEGVGHAYEAGHDVLKGMDFTLRPGTVTAVVGASGAGKSTLARLLLRFFDPNEGRITLGGVDLRQIETLQLYRHLAFVLQDVRLVHASVRENIVLGRPSASAQEVEEAARAAHIHERILALPRGYDSVIGEDAQLSGGEQQRVSIARAVLLDAPVLVLDEPTAAADAESEAAIQEALSRLAAGRTLLVIA